jgi:hypothetical protein
MSEGQPLSGGDDNATRLTTRIITGKKEFHDMHLMRSTLAFFVLLGCVALAPAVGQSPFEENKLNADIDRLLKARDVGEVANELASRKPAMLRDQLKAIAVFARAGHTARVRQAIAQLSAASLPEQHEDRFYINRIIRNAMDADDLATQRIFYEHFSTGGDEHTSRFVELWRKTGDIKELESWLRSRSRKNETWWQHLYEVRKSLGTEDELIDELAADVRANPFDPNLLRKYVGFADDTRDLSWLLELVPSDSSYAAYELASLIHRHAPDLAIKLLEASLQRPFTRGDGKMFAERAFRTAAIAPTGINAEKQLRYWTMKLLARIHSEAKRPQLAQPYVERLTAMDVSDIQAGDQFALAGAVQAQSGQRVVESRILTNEATQREDPQYWIERASYYGGRNEPELVLASLKQGLDAFPHSKTGPNEKRGQIVDMLARTHAPPKSEVRALLWAELEGSEDNPGYQFVVARLLLFNLEDLVDEYFVNNGRLAVTLTAREEWRQDEEALMREVLSSKKWESPKRDAVLRDLVRLAKGKVRERAYALAVSLVEVYEYRHAIPLLEECRKIAGPDYSDRMHFTREDVERKLFESYIETADWRRAKVMYDGGYDYWSDALSQIAVAAAKSGDMENAFRIWQLNASLDRRKLSGLDALAKTAMKPLMRDFYLKMKTRDSLSNVPARALAILN